MGRLIDHRSPTDRPPAAAGGHSMPFLTTIMPYKHPEEKKAYQRAWYEANKDAALARSKAWYGANKDVVIARNKAKYEAEKELILARKKAWYEANKDAIRASRNARRKANRDAVAARKRNYEKARKANEPAYAMMERLRSRLGNALSRCGAGKSASTMQLVSCTSEQLAAHIEAQFLPGMSWDNRSEWHVDHIIPCAAFDLLDPAQQQKCFHYTNLQPLWAADNLRKSTK